VRLFDRLVVSTIPLVPRTLVKKFAARYIAGTTIDDAVRVVRELNEAGYCATLDVLGEHITSKDEAVQAVNVYLAALDTIEQQQLDANISVKLTMMGLKQGRDFCLQNVRQLVEKARELNNFVRIDMEDSSCTTDTLWIFSELRKDFDNVGFVIQAYLRRSLNDIDEQITHNRELNVRICKGIYVEERKIAYKNGEIINSNFILLVRELLQGKHYVGIATHDEKLVWASYKLVKDLQVPKDKFEFQMLLGVDELLRELILKDGYKLRVYVPFGRRWYEYSIRRLQENPKIAGYVVKNVLGMS
jgi:proline dehydrogenase